MSEEGDALGRVQRGGGGSRAVAPSPRSPAAVTRCPAPAHPGLGPPETVNLLTMGRGTSKPGHFNIGAAREREGRLEDTRTRSDPLMGTEGVG